jgi:hypothetical protein
MKKVWHEIQEHRIASGLFLVYWAAAYLLHICRWQARAAARCSGLPAGLVARTTPGKDRARHPTEMVEDIPKMSIRDISPSEYPHSQQFSATEE